MKIKTFILTFLMMMSSPFLFGQHWVDPDFGTENTMPLSATITLDDDLQTEAYQVAAFHGNTLLEVQSIIAFEIPEQGGGGILYHVDMEIPYVDAKTTDIYFKLFNGTNEFVSSTKIDWNEDGYLHKSPLEINFKSVAQIENVVYPTLPEAVAAAQAGETVKLLDNATGAGVVINKDVTIDFGGFTYSFNEGVGSKGTESNGFQILKNNNVTLKNGTLNVNQDDASEFYTIIQNYANLTVDGMTLDGTNLDKWSKVEGDGESKVLSINSGTVNITGATSITANNDGDKAFAFDVYDYTPSYPVPTVNVNTTGTINGKILVSESIPNNLNISAGTFSVEIEEAWCAQGFIPSQIANDTWTVKEGKYVARVNGQGYETFDEAYKAANNDDVIELLSNITSTEIIVIEKAITLDGNNNTLTSKAGRAINVSGANGVTIKNLEINASGERAINVIQNATNVTIDNVTATAANYTVNVASSAPEAVVTIKNSTLTGLNVVNVAAEEANVTVNGGTLVCNDQSEIESYCALTLNKDAINALITATGVAFDIKDDSERASNSAEGGKIIIDGEEEGAKVAIISYGEYFYSFSTLQAAVDFAKENDKIVLIRNISSSEIIVIEKAITLDGNNKTLTSTAGRAINVSGADGVTIQNLNINASGERAINVIQNATNVTIDNVTATAANYTVNVASSAPEAVVTIKNSTLNGLCTVNVGATEANVTVDNCTVNCNDNNTTSGESYAALSLNKDAVRGSIVATNSTINVTEGSDSYKGRNGAEDGTVTINGSTEGVITLVAYIANDGNYYHSFPTLQEAVDFAKENDKIVLIRNISSSEIIVINKAITLDGNNKTLTSKAGRAINVSGANGVTIKNLEINASGERAINVIQNATNVTIDNVTATAANYTVNVASSAPEAVVTIQNSTLTGLNVVNVAAANAKVTVNGGTLVCNDQSGVESYCALTLNKDAINALITATGVAFDIKDDSERASNSAEGGSIIIDGEEEGAKVAIISYGEYFYSFSTLQAAVNKAENGETVTVIRDAAGAGLKINKNVTIDFGGKTYTINQAVGSKGTESQGFQILKEATEVTLKNGNVAVAGKETNVVWMINDYSAELNVTDLTFDCTNMNWDKTPNVYFLVANNQHGTNPAVTLNNVTVNNFAEGSSPYFMEANTTLASADANLNIDVDPGYRVVYEEGVYSVEKLVAYFKNGAYARFVQDKNREHFSLSVYDVYAEYSLVVKVYHNETLLVTTTLREYDLDDETKIFYPYTSGPKGITVNNVVNLGEEGCKPAGSWLNEWAVAPTVENVPNRYEVWVDGELNGELDLTESEFAGFSSKENLQTYLGFKSVYKQASITRGEDVTYYMTFDEALAASQANDVITVLAPVVVTEDKAYNFTDITIKGENVYPVFRIQDGATVTVEGGEVTNPTDYVFVLGDSEQTTSGHLTIKNGTFQGESTVASVTKGNLTIEGGDFSLVEGTTDYRYLINCIDANYKNGTATVAIKGGTFHNWNPQNNAAEGTGTNFCAEGYEAVYEGDTYVVREIQNVKNVTKDTTYPTLAKAIEAASANDELLLLANVTEDVTINKNLTINGDGKEYTGVMSGNAGLTITVNNVKFIEGRFAKDTKSSTGNYTFKNCTFTGNPNLPYALLFKGANTVTVQDCTVKDYQYSFLYVTSGTTTVNVKDVVVENCPSYAVYFASGVTNNMIENLTVKNSNNGIVYNNTERRTLNLKGCTFENVTTIINNAGTNTTTNITSNFYGENNIGNKSFSQYVEVVLKEAGAKLVNAPKGLAVSTTVEGYAVEYEEGETAGFGTYSVIAANVALYRGEDLVKRFATIQDAIDAAQDGDKIVVLKDLTFDDDDVISIDGINTIISVKEKKITLNNEFNISVSYTGDPFLHCVVYVADNSGLTLTGNGTIDVTGVAGTINPSNGKYDYNIAYIFFKRGTTGYLTIDGGNFTAPDLEDSMIYSHGSRLVTVNGGKFTLYNVGTQENGCPWIFNVKGSNEGAVVVNGGTFNADVNHQYWAHEVYVPKTLALKDNGDGTWTVVESEAYITEISSNYNREVGYATLAEAFEATKIITTADNTVTVVKNIELAESITINAGEEVILDLNGMNINVANDQVNFNIDGKLTLEDALGTGVFTSRNHMVNAGGEFIVNAGTVQNIETLNLGFPIYLNGGTVTINGGTVQAVNQDNYAIGGTGGTLTINGGTVKGNWGAVNMASGSATIKGGTLEVTGTKGGHALYVAGDAQVTIENGEFKPYNGSNVASYALVLDSENATVNVSGGMFHKEWGCVYVTAGSLSLTGGTFEQDVNAYCAEGFVAVNNGYGTWTVMPCQEQSLVAGWNWYSSYLNITSDDLTEALGDNATQIKGQRQNDGYMQNGGEGFGWSGNLDLDFAKMYMINATQACDIKLAANVLNPEDYTVVLHSDWNWIGYPSNQEVAINDALANIPKPKEGDVIKTRNSGHAEYAWGMWIGTLKTMIPGEGYMYRNTAGTERQFVYNVEATTRGTVEANYTTENNHWVPNVSEYPFNMTMTAVVDGLANGNYEVAAFVNGEVRGSARPIYVEAIDSYMLFLTINGEDVEEMSFRLYDIDTDTEYDLNNRINYSNNAHLGSVNEPYTFTRGTTGIGEAAMSNINIYPNPTTIGTEINLEATCDKVEVFNALGVKVVEYQNVDSIDALETAGIYVIRITNNGNVQNCRLVVK